MKTALNEMDSLICDGGQIGLGLDQSVQLCYLGSSAYLQWAWHDRM